MPIIIHDLNTDTAYTVDSPDDCKDSTDRAAFELARDLGLTITMGKVIAEPAPVPGPCEPCDGTGTDWSTLFWNESDSAIVRGQFADADDDEAACEACHGTGMRQRPPLAITSRD